MYKKRKHKMFILITIGLFILKYLSLGVLGLFFVEDLELTSSANTLIYTVYMSLAIICFLSLFFYLLGSKILWLIIGVITGFCYFTMYNTAPTIKDIHHEHNIKSRYFETPSTFFERIGDVINVIKKHS